MFLVLWARTTLLHFAWNGKEGGGQPRGRRGNGGSAVRGGWAIHILSAASMTVSSSWVGERLLATRPGPMRFDLYPSLRADPVVTDAGPVQVTWLPRQAAHLSAGTT